MRVEFPSPLTPLPAARSRRPGSPLAVGTRAGAGLGSRVRPAAAAKAALAAALLVPGLAACSEDPAPDTAANLLAEGLSTFDPTGVPWTAATSAQAGPELAGAVAELGELRPEVSVASTAVAEDGATATAVLDYEWDFDEVDTPDDGATDADEDDEADAADAAADAPGDESDAADWTYTTTADLTLVEDAWAVAWSPALLEPTLAAGEQLLLDRLVAERGDVLGAGGTVLVTERPVLRVGIDKTLATPDQLTAAATALAELMDVDAAAFAERVTAAGPEAFVEALVVRADGSYPLDEAALAAIPGARALPDELALAPTREFARPILGSVGQATAELIAASEGRLRAGDVTGLSGLQASQDARLRGQPGIVVQAAPSTGDGEPRELFRREPVAGESLTTTLDLDTQLLAEQLLGPLGPPSAIVAVRPSTGEVVAAASGPGSAGYSTATLGQYAPGSTFKVVTTLGLLRAGLTPDSAVPCTGTVTVDGREFRNYSDYPASAIGDISLREAVANSCNTAMISQHELLVQAALSEAAASLGLGVAADIGVPYFAGSVPTEAAGTAHAAAMIGQGEVQASPLAMAGAAASIASGALVTPRFLAVDSPPSTGAPVPEAPAVHDIMRAVVTEGSASFLSDVTGDVAAKTGTAEYGSDLPPRTHAWMIAIRDDLAVAVFVEDGESGSRTAGPILEEFLRGLG